MVEEPEIVVAPTIAPALEIPPALRFALAKLAAPAELTLAALLMSNERPLRAAEDETKPVAVIVDAPAIAPAAEIPPF